MTRKKYLLLYILTHAAVFLVLGGYLWAFSRGLIPRSFCPFLHLFHLYCPGCGGTRAALALFRGDLIRALLSNPTVPLLIPTVLYYERSALFYFFGKRQAKWPRLWPLLALTVFFLSFFVLRNLLFLAFGIDYLGDLAALRG